jgi:hypothetical protein
MVQNGFATNLDKLLGDVAPHAAAAARRHDDCIFAALAHFPLFLQYSQIQM